MDRVSVSEAEGWWFDPTRARHILHVVHEADDDHFMTLALKQARLAARRGEVPVGAVVVKENSVLAAGRNEREARHDILGHAEIAALKRASRVVGDWRLEGTTVYATLEPCAMCVGAMLAARVSRLVYGAEDPVAGAAGSVLNLADYPGLPHRMVVTGNVLDGESAALLREFFAALRRKASS